MAKRITLREYDRRAEELIKRIRAEAKPFEDDSDEARARRREKARKNFEWFCLTYLPHHFDEGFSREHRKAVKNIHIWNKIIEIMAFRGFGKTTLFLTGYGLYATLFELGRYITVISDSEDQAIDAMMPIKVELENNARIQQDFGNLVSHDWAEDEFVTTTGIKWKAFGWRSKYRGTKFMQFRPDITFIDDLENDENVKNPDQVKKRLDYVLQTVFPAMNRKRKQIFYLTTRLARFCVAGELEKNPEIVKYILPSEKNGKATVPEMFPMEVLKQIRKVIGIVRYSREYLLKILSDETRPFQDQWFIWIPRPEEKYKRIVTFIDPSVGSGQTNDYKAIITVGWSGKYYDVLYAWIRKTTIDHMIRSTYTIYNNYHPHVVGLEANNFQILIKREFQRAAKDEGFQLPIKPVIQKENKESRIVRLSPLIENGYIRFVRGAGDMNLLVDQLLDFPDGANDDGPDALEGAIRLLERLVGKTADTEISLI